MRSIFALMGLTLLALGCSAESGMSGNTGTANKKSEVVSSDKSSGSQTTDNGNKAQQPGSEDATSQLKDQAKDQTTDAAGNSTSVVTKSNTNTDHAANDPIKVTKTMAGSFEDSNTTITITKVNTDSSSGNPQTITFKAGKIGSDSAPGICNQNGTTKIKVGLSNSGTFGNVKNVAYDQSSTTSQITFDPSSCVLNQMLFGKHGAKFDFKCPNSQVQIVK